jgi:hypothetical protein
MCTQVFTVPTTGRRRHVDLWVWGVEFEGSTRVDGGFHEAGFARADGCAQFPLEDRRGWKSGRGVAFRHQEYPNTIFCRISVLPMIRRLGELS